MWMGFAKNMNSGLQRTRPEQNSLSMCTPQQLIGYNATNSSVCTTTHRDELLKSSHFGHDFLVSVSTFSFQPLLIGNALVNGNLLCVKSPESTYLPHFFTCVIVIYYNCVQVLIDDETTYTHLPHAR